jgi:hypothetical protein
VHRWYKYKLRPPASTGDGSDEDDAPFRSDSSSSDDVVVLDSRGGKRNRSLSELKLPRSALEGSKSRRSSPPWCTCSFRMGSSNDEASAEEGVRRSVECAGQMQKCNAGMPPTTEMKMKYRRVETRTDRQ